MNFPDQAMLSLRAKCLCEALDRHDEDDAALSLAERMLRFMLSGSANDDGHLVEIKLEDFRGAPADPEACR